MTVVAVFEEIYCLLVYETYITHPVFRAVQGYSRTSTLYLNYVEAVL